MKILKRDAQEWRLRVESVDDLWTLTRLARSGTTFGMLGERRDQTTGGEEGGRAKQAERKKMWIELAVLSSEHVPFSDVLRVHGTIEKAPIDIGMHHTHIVEVRDDVMLRSSHPWSSIDVDLLLESEEAAKRGEVALLVVEGDEMILFFVTGRGLKESATWTMRGGGKRSGAREAANVAHQFRSKVVHGLTQQLSKEIPLVICGPGHNRDRVLAELKSEGHVRQMISVGTKMGGRGAANEVLQDGLAGSILEHHNMVQEIALLNESLTRIGTNGAVAYGRSALQRAMEEGAIETLLISADLLREPSVEIDGKTWMTWAEQLSAMGGKLVQCSTDHDPGEQLLGMGGAIALLRYRMD